MQGYSEMHQQHFDDDLWDSSLPAQASPGVAPGCSRIAGRLAGESKPLPIARHGYSRADVAARYEEEPVGWCRHVAHNWCKPVPAVDPMAPPAGCSHYISGHEYTHAEALDRRLQRAAHSC